MNLIFRKDAGMAGFSKEVEILSTAGGLYLIRFLDSGGGIKVKEHRLFATKEEAERSIRKH